MYHFGLAHVVSSQVSALQRDKATLAVGEAKCLTLGAADRPCLARVIELGDAYTAGNDAQDLHADLREGRYVVQHHCAYASGAAGRSSARSSASGGP